MGLRRRSRPLVGFALTGDQVSDSPALVDAKLTGSLVLAPAEQVRELADAYRAACQVGGGQVSNLVVPRRERNAPATRRLSG